MVALMMEAAVTSESLVNFYPITRRYNPEGSPLPLDRQADFICVEHISENEPPRIHLS
jgi:hypothetical protein